MGERRGRDGPARYNAAMRKNTLKRLLREHREEVAARTRLIEQQRLHARLSRRARSLRTSLNRGNRRLKSP
jgi:hypothetical protein